MLVKTLDLILAVLLRLIFPWFHYSQSAAARSCAEKCVDIDLYIFRTINPKEQTPPPDEERFLPPASGQRASQI